MWTGTAASPNGRRARDAREATVGRRGGGGIANDDCIAVAPWPGGTTDTAPPVEILTPSQEVTCSTEGYCEGQEQWCS